MARTRTRPRLGPILAALWIAPGAAAQGKAGAEVAWALERPVRAWLEIPDARRLERDLEGSRIARLVQRFSGALDTEALEQALLPEELAEKAEALRTSSGSGFEALLEGLLTEVGVEASEAGELVALLEGDLVLAVLEPREAGEVELPLDLLAAVGLRAGASEQLIGLLSGLERLEVRDYASGRAALWKLEPAPGLPAGFLVVQPHFCAWTFDREGAKDLLRLGSPGDLDRPDHAATLSAARERSRARGELGFLLAQGAWIEASQVAALLGAFDFGPLSALELGLRVEAGELASRVRLERAEPPEPSEPTEPAEPGDPAPARTATPWAGLALLPADTLAVVGLAASPWRTFRALLRAAEELELGTDPGPWAERLEVLPFFAGLGAPEALAQETLFFARPRSAPGLPMLYLTTPKSPWLAAQFAQLEERRLSEVPLGDGLLLRQKLLPGASRASAWVLAQGTEEERRSIFSLARREESFVVSDLSAHLSDLWRALDRERPEDRGRAQAEVRRRLQAVLAQAGAGPESLVGFLHVRAGPLAELAWPYALLALQFTEAVEDPEELPEPFELGELVGDTTSVVLDLGQAVEIHGRGLLGGLAVFL